MCKPRTFLALFAVLALSVVTACTSDDGDDGGASTTASTTATTSGDDDGGAGGSGGDEVASDWIVFNGQGNDLDVYAPDPPFDTQKLITNANDDPNGLDLNAQICFFDPGGEYEGETWFIGGEDTGQPDPPAGWGIFRLEGDEVGDLSAEEVGKLTPTYQAGADPENYGCGLLSDGRMLTTDIGNQALGEATGQLIVWFPPFDSFEVSYCKLDIGVGTAQSIWVDEDDNVFVASSRGTDARPGGVYRYSPPFPTGPDDEGGCGQTDGTGAPMADSVTSELWIEATSDTGLGTPAGLAPTPDGGLYVSSVFTGVINEYDADGAFVRTILAPPDGEEITPEGPYSTGTPLGIGVGPDGTIYYADIGLVAPEGDLPGPGPATGTLRRIVFGEDGEPGEPQVMAEDLRFPDGIGVFWPGHIGGSGSSPTA